VASPHAAAARWADLWATDRKRLVGERYAEDAVRVEVGGPGSATLRGRDALVEDEHRLYRLVPDHRARLLRVLVDAAGRQVVEALVTGTSAGDLTRMAVPALWWWELDGEGLIRREWRWLDWAARRLDDGRVGGRVPDHQPPGTEAHSQGWYRSLAERMAETWAWDPQLMVRSLFADDCEVVPVHEPERRVRGLADLGAVETVRAARLPRRSRRFDVLDVLGEGRAFALRYRLGRVDGGSGGAGTAAEEDESGETIMVATLDSADRITSARIYGDGLGASAVAGDPPGAARTVPDRSIRTELPRDE
jgi:hypothetical protein